MKVRRFKRGLIVAVILIAVVASLGAAWVHHLGKVHRHCIKIAGTLFAEYAMKHGGTFPYHTNGFGDALLQLVKGRPEAIAFICGPGDDGHVFSNALHVPEEECSRIYVQGLSHTNDPGLCILFDRRSVRGGDHFYGSGKSLREVCMLDGSMQTVPDERWAEFGKHQVELLVAAGFKREIAMHYYLEAF